MVSALLALSAGLIAPAPVIRPVEYDNQQYYRTSHALIIGVESGPNGMPTFGKAARDLGKVLIDRCDFPAENVVVLDGNKATVRRIREELTRLEEKSNVSPDDRVIVALAMHGEVTQNVGQFVAVDGKIPMTVVRDSVLRGIPARQVMGWLDACYAGLVALPKGSSPSQTAGIPRLSQLPVRQLWAGASSEDRTVTNDSTQKSSLLSSVAAGLSLLTAQQKGFVTDLDLFSEVNRQVAYPFAVKSEGTFVFRTPVAPGFQSDARSAAARQRQQAQISQSAADLLRDETVLGRVLRTIEDKNSERWFLMNLRLAEALIQPVGWLEYRLPRIRTAVTEAKRGINPDSPDQAYLRLLSVEANLAVNEGISPDERRRLLGALSAQLDKTRDPKDADQFVNGFYEYVRLLLTDLNSLGVVANDPVGNRFAEYLYQLLDGEKISDPVVIQLSTGALVSYMAGRGPGTKEEMDRAVRIVERALSRVDADASPVQWAQLQHVYSMALGTRISRNVRMQEDTPVLLGALDKALQVFGEEEFPIQWASLQYQLAVTLLQNPTLANRREEGFAAADRALTVYTRERDPMLYSGLHASKGIAYMTMNRKEDARKSFQLAHDCLKPLSPDGPLFKAVEMLLKQLEGGKQ